MNLAIFLFDFSPRSVFKCQGESCNRPSCHRSSHLCWVGIRSVMNFPIFFIYFLSDTLFWYCSGATKSCGLERGSRAQPVRQSLNSLLRRRKIFFARRRSNINLDRLNCQKYLKSNAQKKKSLCQGAKMKTPRYKWAKFQSCQSSCPPWSLPLLPPLLPTSKILDQTTPVTKHVQNTSNQIRSMELVTDCCKTPR